MFNILIIDDDDMIRFTLECLLEDEGFKIFNSSTAVSGLEMAAKENINLAIIDIHIPDMDGAELVKEINNLKPNIKIIIHTGDHGYTVSKELIGLGIDQKNVLLKPILNINTLTNKINNLI